MRNSADVTGGKPIAVWSQSISGVNAVNPLVAFYDIHGRKREVLFFYLSRTPHEAVPDTTQSLLNQHKTQLLLEITDNGNLIAVIVCIYTTKCETEEPALW
jgi:hypothetical protein